MEVDGRRDLDGRGDGDEYRVVVTRCREIRERKRVKRARRMRWVVVVQDWHQRPEMGKAPGSGAGRITAEEGAMVGIALELLLVGKWGEGTI